jgi:hypothetical protein
MISMQSNLKISALAFGAIVASVVAGQSNAQSLSFSTPAGTFTGNPLSPSASYSYTSPKLSVFAGVGFGNNQNTAVLQHSALNVSSFAQVGNHVNASVFQAGLKNISNISQVGHNSSAFVIQFGP